MIKKLSTPKAIHWGIIGLGNIAHKFAEDLVRTPNAILHAVASRSQSKALLFAEKYKAKNAYGSYEDLVKDPKLDAVYIATPHTFHKAHTLLCLEHAIPVLCEKPFAIDAEEVKQMFAVAKAKNVLLMEALWTYFLPHYQFVLKLLNDKTYGHIKRLEADFGFFRDFDNSSRVFNKSLGGGSLLDIGIYPIFAALSTLGLPEHIDAKATFFNNGTDASCDIRFDYKNGATAVLKSSFLENLPTEAIFYCEKATIKINTRFLTPTSVTIASENKNKSFDFTDYMHGYNYEILHFNDLIRQGKTESHIMTHTFSLQLIETLDAVRKIIKLQY